MQAAQQTSQYWIDNLQLQPHPEGGYYRETYRSRATAPATTLPAGFTAQRNYCTAIFYLLQQGDFSAFHRIRSDELWHFHFGGSLRIEVLENGEHRSLNLGRDLHEGECLQCMVPAGAWFAAAPLTETSFVLAGCTVSPGFDFADLEMANRDDLAASYPAQRLLIEKYTR